MSIPDSVITLLREAFEASVPHNRALGMKLVEVVEGGMVSELPYKQELVGNPEAGFLHGGAITSLIDATCGMSVAIKMMRPMRIATLDLRIDYLRPAIPGQSVFCRATCYKVTSQIAFVRAMADCGPDTPVASAAGTFVIFQDSKGSA